MRFSPSLISFSISIVNVELGLTSISLTWDPRLTANVTLAFEVANDIFVRTLQCQGDTGRKVINNLLLRANYRATVYRVTNDGNLLRREVVFSSLVRMPHISESFVFEIIEDQYDKMDAKYDDSSEDKLQIQSCKRLLHMLNVIMGSTSSF